MSGQLCRLSQWLKSADISWEESLIQLRTLNGSLGIFAVRDVEEGAMLCEIPKSAVLSVQNTGIADLLKEHRIRGGLGVILAIMYEMSIGPQSPW